MAKRSKRRKQRFIHVGTSGFGNYWCRTVLGRLVNELGVAEPAAAVDIVPDHLVNAHEGYGIAPDKCYTDARKAFAENEADFAVVVVPPAHHESIVNLAVKHGLHILSEKPIADTMKACCRIYKKVQAARLKMAVTMSHRFDQDKQSLERQVKSGRYGATSHIIGRNTWNNRTYASWGQFRHEIPDALLVEGTVHHFDIMRALADSNAATVYARTWNPPWGEFKGDSCALVTIEMQNGVKVFYEGAKTNACALNGWGQSYWRVECDKATLELDRRNLRIMSDLSGERVIHERPLEQQPAWRNEWLAEMFVDWLGGGDAPPNNLDDNIQCAALLFAAIESAHTGKVVDVQAYLKKHLKAVKA